MARSNLEFLQVTDLDLQGQSIHTDYNWRGSRVVPVNDPSGVPAGPMRANGVAHPGISISYQEGDIVSTRDDRTGQTRMFIATDVLPNDNRNPTNTANSAYWNEISGPFNGYTFATLPSLVNNTPEYDFGFETNGRWRKIADNSAGPGPGEFFFNPINNMPDVLRIHPIDRDGNDYTQALRNILNGQLVRFERLSGTTIVTETVRASDTSVGTDFSFTFTDGSSIDETQFAVNSDFIIGFGDETRNIEWVPKIERLQQLTDVPNPDPDTDTGRVLKVSFNDDNPVFAWQDDIDTNTDATLITDEVQHMAVTGSVANTHIASGTSRIINMNINEAYVSKQVQRPYFQLMDFLGGTDFPVDTATSTTISFRNTLVANFFFTLVGADPVGGFPVVVSTGMSDLDPVATITGRMGGVNSLDYVGTNLDQFNRVCLHSSIEVQV